MATEKEKIGRYEILDKLGQGAMGVVYKARDPNIGRIVALKTMAQSANFPEEQRKEYAKRFFREAQSAGALQHPNIVTIYDMDEDEGIPFIAMEYIEGKSLSKIIEEKGKIPVVEAISIIKQVTEGLSFAHDKGIVHRDIKPDNILVDRNGRAVVTDFGIAHLEESNLTRTGEVLGTPFFMSPEQILEGKLDRRSDLFSLGVVFYLMLTGRRPFKGETISSICYHIVHTVPDQLPDDSSIPTALISILNKLLEKDPERRYLSGKALIEDLQKTENLIKENTQETMDSQQKKVVPTQRPHLEKEDVIKPTPPVNKQQEPTQEKKKKSSFAFVLIIGSLFVVICLVAVLGGGYFLYKKGVIFPPKIEETEQQQKSVIKETNQEIVTTTNTVEKNLELKETTSQKKTSTENPPPTIKKEKTQKKVEKSSTQETKTNDTVTPPPPQPPIETKPQVKPSKIGLIFETKISEISLTFFIDREEKLREVFVTESGTRFSQEFKVTPGEHEIKVVVQATKFPPFIREDSFNLNVPEGSHQIIKVEPARKPTPKLTIKKIDSQTGQSSIVIEK